MPRLPRSPEVKEGYAFWLSEIENERIFNRETHYIPVIALVGIYSALCKDKGRLTSYDWRQSVLSDQNATEGLRKSLSGYAYEILDEKDTEVITDLEPNNYAGHHVCAYASIVDGLPDEQETIPANELFLANTLGYAVHDYAIALRPLTLIVQGPQAFRNHYPLTARYVESQQP